MLIIKLTKMKCTKRLSKSPDRGIFTPLVGSSSYKVQMFQLVEYDGGSS